MGLVIVIAGGVQRGWIKTDPENGSEICELFSGGVINIILKIKKFTCIA